MLPKLEKIEANINHSFQVNHMKVDRFPSPLHFHPEIEILLLVQGKGTRIIGDSVERFAPGDLVMIGKNVPHVWYSDESLFQKDNNTVSEAIYIEFNSDIFGEKFWDLPELKHVKKIIEFSQRGVLISGSTRQKASSIMRNISTSVGFKRVSLLFDLLELIASGGEYKFLSSPVFKSNINHHDSDKLNKIYQYVLNNIDKEITLDEIASISNYSTPAFCRYFKKRANKTFVQFLNEIRVGQACRLLVDEDYMVADICFMCGFNNISYFIKQFKKITGYTPKNYRKKFMDFI